MKSSLRLRRSKRLAASVEPSKGSDDEIGQVKTEIENLEAEIENVEAALGGRRNDAGDYAEYATMSFSEREGRLRSLRK